MINPTCPLNSKYKLGVVLNGECGVVVKNSINICSGCSFFQFPKGTTPADGSHTHSLYPSDDGIHKHPLEGGYYGMW